MANVTAVLLNRVVKEHNKFTIPTYVKIVLKDRRRCPFVSNDEEFTFVFIYFRFIPVDSECQENVLFITKCYI